MHLSEYFHFLFALFLFCCIAVACSPKKDAAHDLHSCDKLLVDLTKILHQSGDCDLAVSAFSAYLERNGGTVNACNTAVSALLKNESEKEYLRYLSLPPCKDFLDAQDNFFENASDSCIENLNGISSELFILTD